jgi:arylsulfatase
MCGYMGRGNANNNWPDDPFLKNKGPFRGGKFSALEGGVRVPFFVSYPGYSAKVISKPVWLIDFYATAAEIAGVDLQQKTDGKSLIPLLKGEPSAVFDYRPMYFYRNTEQAVRMGSWKAYRKSPENKIELYLIEDDIHSDCDLAAKYPEVVQQMDSIMNVEHEPHKWYRDPLESDDDFAKVVEEAKRTNNLQRGTRPNGLK